MRSLVDIVDNLTGVVRLIIGAIVLIGFGVTFMMTAGVSYVAPKVAADYGERAERIGEQAIQAAQEEARARELAKDGWGYEAPSSSDSYDRRSRDRDGDAGGWGSGS